MKKVFKQLLSADFETTFSDFSKKLEKETTKEFFERCPQELPQVYSWDIFDGEKHFYGINIKDFINHIVNTKKHSIVYFHNGSKFDLHFLLPKLIDLKYSINLSFPKELNSIEDLYTYADTEQKEQNINRIVNYFLEKANKIFKQEKWDTYSLEDKKYLFDKNLKGQKFRKELNKKREGGIDVIVDGSYKIISLIMYSKHKTETRKKDWKGEWVSEEGKPYKIEFKDSNLLVIGSLASYGKILNNKYNTDKYSKLDLDSGYLRKEQYKNIRELENDGNELEYLKQDTFILWNFINDLINSNKLLTLNNLQLTSAGTAYKLWKYHFMGKKLLNEKIKNKEIKVKNLKNGIKQYIIEINEKEFKMTSKKIKDYLVEKFFNFSELEEDVIKDMYLWYMGGMSFTNPIYRGIPVKEVALIDINSSYPNAMYNYDLPYGAPLYNKKLDNKYFQLIRVNLEGDLYNENGLPFLPAFNGKSSPYSKLVKKDYNEMLYLNTNNFNQFKKYYKGKYSYEVVYSFKKIKGEYMFKEYIDYWMELKKDSKGKDAVMYAFSKVMLNSLYGKFGTKRVRTTKFYIDGEWSGYTFYAKSEFYLPLAIAITTIGRMKLVDLVDNNYRKVLAGDTDSIIVFDRHIKNIKKLNEFDPKKLGAWDVELTQGQGVVRRPKQYFFRRPDKSVKLAYAGIHPSELDLDNFKISDFINGKFIQNQKTKTTTPTGVSIFEVEKEIREIWNEDYDKSDRFMEVWYHDKYSYMKNLKKQIKIVEQIKQEEWL